MLIDEEAFASQICAELPPQLRPQLKSVLRELLQLRMTQQPWYQKIAKAVVLTTKSRTARQVWRTYNHHIGARRSVLTGYSYSDQYFMFIFDSLSMAFSIVFFNGASFAKSLASRLDELQ